MIFGMTGSGKTTFALRYLLNVPAACRFVFDDKGQIAARLRIRHAGTAAECEAALATRWVVFNPHRMFPGETANAFRWFCQWVYGVSRRGRGKKVLLVDEVWQWCSPHGIPKELAVVSQTGRAENLELVVASQMPHKLHSSIVGQSTELVCFRLQERLALQSVRDLGLAEDPSLLDRGAYLALNRLSGGILTGRIF